MARITFGNEIQRLEADVLSLGHMVQKAIVEVVEALRRQDATVAHRIIADDAYVNNRRYDIEAECMALIATQQPMARDLRTLAAILAIASELERIHDYAKGIGKIILLIGHQPLNKAIIDLPRMAAKECRACCTAPFWPLLGGMCN